MTIVQQPDSISFTGNIKDFIIQSAEEVSFVLSAGTDVIIDELYTPNVNGEVSISLADILNAELSLSLPGATWITEQPLIARTFTTLINGTSVSFTAVRGGVDGLSVSAGLYIRQRFLTGQPTLKKISREQPEYLCYYAIESCTLYIDSGAGAKPIASLMGGKAYLFNLSYAQVKFLAGNEAPEAFEVWIALYNGITTDRQKYRYVAALGPDEEYFVWENGFGGMDVARFTGQATFAPKQTHNVGYFGQQSKEYRTDVEKIYSKNTGHKLRDEYLWLYDFLMRNNRYKYVNGQLLPIVLDKSTLQYPSHEYVTSFSFDYRFSNSKPYLSGKSLPINAYWSDYLCQLSPTLDYVFLFSENQDVNLQKTVPNVGDAVRVQVSSLQAGLPYGDITAQGLPSWATLTKDGVEFILTMGGNTGNIRTQNITFVQGESGKTITLQLIQLGTEVYNPFVALTDNGTTTAIIGGNTYLEKQ